MNISENQAAFRRPCWSSTMIPARGCWSGPHWKWQAFASSRRRRRAALKRFGEHPVDCVVLDVVMPG